MKVVLLLSLALVACDADTFVSPDAGDSGAPDVLPGEGGPTCAAGQILCGATCVDTSSDVAHCGSCKTSCTVLDAGAAACMGGNCVYPMGDSACLALNGNDVFWTNGRGPGSSGVYRVAHGLDGGAPKVISTGDSVPQGIFADDTQVYWSDVGLGNDMGSVHRAKTDGSSATVVADSANGVSRPGPVIAASGNVYWGNGDSSVWFAPTGGGLATLATTTFGPPVFLVATNTAIYWTSNSPALSGSPTIGTYKFGAPAGSSIFTGNQGEAFGGLWVATDDDTVCLARTSQQNVSCGLFKVTGPTIALVKSTAAYGLVETSNQTTLYWTERIPGGSIARVDVGTNAVTKLAQDDSPSCVAIDGQYVYWTARGRLTPGVAPR
ncbi:MAG TPA: hypothetical protein VGH28_25105 [Polyangiaceae bacterium]|jgi:hypothetical protein